MYFLYAACLYRVCLLFQWEGNLGVLIIISEYVIHIRNKI